MRASGSGTLAFVLLLTSKADQAVRAFTAGLSDVDQAKGARNRTGGKRAKIPGGGIVKKETSLYNGVNKQTTFLWRL